MRVTIRHLKPNGFLSFSDTGKDAMCCKYTEDMHNIAVGFTDGSIHLYDCQNGARTHVLTDAETLEEPGPVTGIKHRPVSTAHPITETIICSCKHIIASIWSGRENS